MRKSTVFISTVLTGFMLAVLYGVVSAYQQVVKPTNLAAQTQPAAIVQPVSQPAEVVQQPAAVTNITPEQAAGIASKVIGRTDLYSVEISTYNGVEAYLVTFSSGDLVYVGLDGQILSVSKLPVTVINQPSNNRGNHNNQDNAASSNGESHHDGEGGGDD